MGLGLSELVDGERNPAGPADVRPAMRSRRIVAPAVVLLLAGCAVQTIPTPGPVSPLSLPTLGPGARDCGTLVLRQGQDVPADAARCVIEAHEREQIAEHGDDLDHARDVLDQLIDANRRDRA